ncbi:uncharacterized protein M6B38_171130 [Iris pallida]|uniref:Transmembrane protein n=1 Tax=Iris pallida TaxID=29817 RepID=A0AAX6DIP8_IRIPA|nr:Uncharacterized protein M6B38_243290 [Iris pallida]KAJ6807723.1 uncharacterized protein M6B38_171130 [Iris pallida]
MVHMDLNGSMERDIAIDLESGTNAPIGDEALMNGFAGCEESTKFDQGCDDGEGNGSPLERKKVGGEERTTKKKKKSAKKPPKPPRPPRAPSMDAADEKLVREMNELAMLKRARVERMRALRRTKNNAKAANTNANLVPWIITLIFCIVIIWQGFFSRGGPSLRFHGSPESPVRARGGFISIQFFNASAAQGSISASPNNVEQVSGLDNRGGGSRAAG